MLLKSSNYGEKVPGIKLMLGIYHPTGLHDYNHLYHMHHLIGCGVWGHQIFPLELRSFNVVDIIYETFSVLPHCWWCVSKLTIDATSCSLLNGRMSPVCTSCSPVSELLSLTAFSFGGVSFDLPAMNPLT